jgi:sulfite reductase alpha subunit-like flavoprotein
MVAKSSAPSIYNRVESRPWYGGGCMATEKDYTEMNKMKIIRVLFASQTGTAEQVAKRIRRDLIRKLPGQLSSDTGSCVCLPVSNLDQAVISVINILIYTCNFY